MTRRHLSLLFIAFGVLEATSYTYDYKTPAGVVYNPTPSVVYYPETSLQSHFAPSYSAPVPTDDRLDDQENDCSTAMENYKKMRNVIGYHALEASHYMIPDKALIDLAHDMNYEYSETVSNKHSKTDRKSNDGFSNNAPGPKLSENQILNKRFGQQPPHGHIKVDYACTDDHLSWTETNPYNGKVLKYERRYDDDKKFMEYRMLSGDQLLNYVFGSKALKNQPDIRRTAISSRQGGFFITIGTIIAGLFAIPLLVGIGAMMTMTISAAIVLPVTVISLLVARLTSPCFIFKSYAPCSCAGERNSMGLVIGAITCPAGSNITQIQNVFAKIPMDKKIGKVILNLPSGTNEIPVNILSQQSVEIIQLIGAGNTNKITINQGAFSASALTLSQLIIQNLDVVNLDYSFLNNFNSLSSVQINQSSNAPTTANLPRNLQQNLPKLSNFLVDNKNIYPNCPYPGILLPCTCVVGAGQTAGTITCPAPTTVPQIQNAFSLIPAKTNVDSFILNFEAATLTTIPAYFLSNIPGTSIELIGANTATKSRLQINTAAFTASAPTDKKLTFRNFDVSQVNYAFLNGFNVLTTIDINACSGNPTGNPATLPTNLPALTAINVDGNNVYTKPANR